MKYFVNTISKFLLGGLFLSLVCSCEEHVINDGSEEVVEILCNPDTSFSTEIEPIIQANCVRCHNGSQPPNLTSYSRISSNANSIQAAVVSRRMPLGGSLSNEEIEAIKCWVDNGAQDN